MNLFLIRLKTYSNTKHNFPLLLLAFLFGNTSFRTSKTYRFIQVILRNNWSSPKVYSLCHGEIKSRFQSICCATDTNNMLEWMPTTIKVQECNFGTCFHVIFQKIWTKPNFVLMNSNFMLTHIFAYFYRSRTHPLDKNRISNMYVSGGSLCMCLGGVLCGWVNFGSHPIIW